MPGRRASWLHLWAGTGAGYLGASGHEHAIWINNTVTQDGVIQAAGPEVNILGDQGLTVTGGVRVTNRPEKFDAFYIPASLHLEAEVAPRLTLGVKGELDCLLGRAVIAPRELVFVLATVRYNFVQK